MKHLLVISAVIAAILSPGLTRAQSSLPIIAEQKANELSIVKFKGMDVFGSDDKKIGDVIDVIFSDNTRVVAYVVAVGGFLGMGAKLVAIPPSAFEMIRGKNGAVEKLKVNAAPADFKHAAHFKYYDPPAVEKK